MTSRRSYWCPKTMKRRPCWCPKPILWELNSFLMQTLSFVPINLHRCWPHEWKHSIDTHYVWAACALTHLVFLFELLVVQCILVKNGEEFIPLKSWLCCCKYINPVHNHTSPLFLWQVLCKLNSSETERKWYHLWQEKIFCVVGCPENMQK